jgi:tape measure domain-containing protein
MEVFGLGIRIQEEGSATVEAAIKRLRAELEKTAATANNVGGTITGLTNRTNGLATSFRTAGATSVQSAGLMESSLRKVGAQFAATYLGVQALTNGIRSLVQISDTMLLLEGRIGLVADSTENLAFLQNELYKSANLTRSSYEATAELYARVARNGDQLGYSQENLLRFTELTQMSIRTSGINAIEASRGMIQLSQAMASGVLRGDEFRAVMEQMPGLSRAMAAGLGVTVGQLREMAMAGELTAVRIMDAILSMDESIRKDFKALPVTIGDGFTVLGNVIAKSLENANKMTGASQTLGTALKNLAIISLEPLTELFVALGKLVIFNVKLFGTLGSTIGVIALAVLRLVNGIGAIIQNLVLAPLTLLPVIGEKVVVLLDKLNNKAKDTDATFAKWQESLKEWRGELINLEIDLSKIGKSVGEAGNAVNGFGLALKNVAMPAMGEAITRVESFRAAMARLRAEELLRRQSEAEARSAEGFRKAALFGVDIEAIKSRTLVGNQAQTLLDQMRMEAGEIGLELRETFTMTIATGIAMGIADGLVAGFQAAFAGGGIGEGFKALTAAMLGGLGSMLIAFGTKALLASQLMADLRASLASFDPTGSVGRSLAIIALGAALKGAAQASFGGAPGGGGRGSMGLFSGGGMSALPTQQIIFGATSATTAAGMTPRQSMNVTIIGPNDPSAQRAIQELMTKANSRGRIG